MAKVFIEEQTLTDIANAVRGKNGTTEPIRTTELATAITNLPTGGKGVLELLYTEGAEITLEDWETDELAFSTGIIITGTKCKKVTLPPNLAQNIGLEGNTNLTEYIATSISAINQNAFNECSNLEVACFPCVTTLSANAFVNAGKSGSKLIMPNLLSVPGAAFNYRANGTKFSLIDIGVSSNIGNQCFGNCPNLEAFVIRKTDGVCVSAGPIFWSGGYPNKIFITYVPALSDAGEDMVSLYQTATNWTVVADRIKPHYTAKTVEDIETLLNDDSIAEGSMIICDVNHSYTIKGGNTL